jgi:hypothetical protein
MRPIAVGCLCIGRKCAVLAAASFLLNRAVASLFAAGFYRITL